MGERLNPALEHPHETGPAAGELVELLDGIYWKRIPIPFELNHINVWLLEEENSFTLVDTGIFAEHAVSLWQDFLKGGLRGKPLGRVIVTHFHPDHIGMASWLLDASGAQYRTSKETEEMSTFLLENSDAPPGEDRETFYKQHGVNNVSLFEDFFRGKYYSEIISGKAACDAHLQHGEKIRVGGDEWQVLMAYGHAPGHVTLFSPQKNCLISGDQLLPTITTNIAVHATAPEANPLQEFIDSFELFRVLPRDVLVMPAHGLPFRGVEKRLDQLQQHHEDTLASTYEICHTPKNTIDIVPRLFRRELTGLNEVLAFGETLAHLNYLYLQGKLSRFIDKERYYFKQAVQA